MTVLPTIVAGGSTELVPTLVHSLNMSNIVTFMSDWRPHQGKDNLLLFPQHTSDPLPRDGPVLCRQRLGGRLKFYYQKAA
jgi:hypothetical protein